MHSESHVLVVMAHPDDETFGVGGTIALYTRAGVPVTYACATGGEMGRRMGKPTFANRETLRHLRAEELRAACAALGVSDLRFLGIWDKTVEFADPGAVAAKVAALLAEKQPSLVITHHPVYGGHPDHNAVGAAVVRAVAALPAGQRPRLHCTTTPPYRLRILKGEDLGFTLEYNDVTAVAHVKQAATAAHRSQSEGLAEQIAARAERDPDYGALMERSRGKEFYMVYSL